MIPTLTYDAGADAVYIRLSDLPYAFGEDLDHERRVDYAESGQPIGIEIFCVSQGVDTHGLPSEDAVNRLIRQHHFKLFA